MSTPSRDAMIEAMREVIMDEFQKPARLLEPGERQGEVLAIVALDALLAARVPIPCETCEGAGGWYSGPFLSEDEFESCYVCDGSGSRDGGSALIALLIERGEMEAVEIEYGESSGILYRATKEA